MLVFRIILFSLFLLLYACATVSVPLEFRYDIQRDLYIVAKGPQRGAVLRDKQGNIIRQESERALLLKQYRENDENQSPILLEFEKETLFVRYEHSIAFFYFSGVKEINKGNYLNALGYFEKAENLYPQIIYYSDLSFLVGYCYEKLGNQEKAEKYYGQFINKSAQKYSARFNEKDRVCAGVYREQLDYARAILRKGVGTYNKSFTENEIIKYYNNYQYPGFEVGLWPGISSIGFSVIPNVEKIEESYFSLGMSYTFNTWFDAGGTIGFPAPFFCDVSTDFQLFRSKDRRLGLSLETSLLYLLKDNYIENNESVALNPPLHFINPGIKLGIGFYILPDLFVGGYFQNYFFNEYNKFEFMANGIPSLIWNNNAYRVTLKYLFFKKADLDISFRNKELYAGTNIYFYSYNLFLGYGFLENRFVIQLNSVDLIQ